MVDIKAFFRNDNFAQHLGVELLHASHGQAKVCMKMDKRHLNAMNIGHGGVVFSLADIAFAVASNSHGTIAMAINVSISFLKAVTGGTLVAEAEEVARNPRLATYVVRVRDDSGDLVAVFQGMVYRKKDPIRALPEENGA